jgi:DnaJ-class molecular chaperone
MTLPRNPYEILGLSKGATREEIKQQYRRLAKIHHPDRWAGKDISAEALHEHQERFKNITVAYHVLMENENDGWGGAGGGGETTNEPWEHLWKRMEDLLSKKNVMEHLSSFLKRTFRDVPEPSVPTTTREHVFTIPVSFEEIHARRKKKVRLMMKNHPEPLFITVLCDKYPRYETVVMQGGTMIRILLILHPKIHPVYTLDYIEDDDERVDETSGYNLFREIPMHLMDYFVGKTVEWEHLDGESIHITLPPFLAETDGENYKIGFSNLWKKLPGRGLLGRGDVYITLDWKLPTEPVWNMRLNQEEKDALILILEKLTHR